MRSNSYQELFFIFLSQWIKLETFCLITIRITESDKPITLYSPFIIWNMKSVIGRVIETQGIRIIAGSKFLNI